MARSLKEHLDPTSGPKRILALDGGGVKGLLTLGMLQSLEAELRTRSGDPNFRLCDYYDLIGGTSTGSIIASGLALGLSVDELIQQYLALAPAVFGRRVGDGNLFRPKYNPADLRAALSETLGRKTLGSADVKTGLAICMKRIDTGSAWVVTNHPNSPYFDNKDPDSKTIPNKRYRLIDLVMASAAAPTFFDEVVIDIADGDEDAPPQRGYFVDGAVGANNNPSMQMLMLALIPAYGFGWGAGADQLMMTSFGTGQRRPQIDGEDFADKPPGFRGIHALQSMIFDTQIQGVMLLQSLSEPKRPWLINSEVKDMRGALLGGREVLDFQRIDVLLPVKSPAKNKARAPINPTSLETLLGRELPAKAHNALDEMENGKADNLALLLEVGRATGPNFIGSDYPDPRFNPPHWKPA
jgi:hypothetical protein